MAETKTLRIYFTSDIHGHIYPTDFRSPEEKDLGLFKCAHQFEKDGNTLIIDGGDLLQGSPLGAFQHDSVGTAQPFAHIMNACGYDYVTLGNHDFNFGMDYLGSYLDQLDARCICQNVLTEDGTVRFPWKLHVLENGLRIGLVGIITDHVNVWERPEHLAGHRIVDSFPAVKAALEEMKPQVDLTVCVYHGGFERDLDTDRVLSTSTENIGCRLCRELDFDILLTGHQHMSIPGRSLHGTFIVQPTDCGREFLRVTAEVSGGRKRISSETLPASGPCSQALMDRFQPMNLGAQQWLDAVVGHLARPLVPDDHLTMAASGNDLADFFNEVQLDISGAQLSVASLANEVAGMPQVVRRRDVLTAYPYTNTLTVLEVPGRLLRQAIERSAEYFALQEDGSLCISDAFLKPKVEHYNFDYYAGVDYEIDVRRPLGQRLVSLTCGGREVADDTLFTVCLNSYRASGAGGYPGYPQCRVLQEINTEMSDLILEFFRRHPTVDVTPRHHQTLTD